MQNLAPTAAVLAIGLVLAQPPATLVIPAAAQAVANGTPEPDADPRMWRGKEPNICLVRECERAEPTFCLVGRGPAKNPMRHPFDPQGLCDQHPGFRDALHSQTIGTGARPLLRETPRR